MTCAHAPLPADAADTITRAATRMAGHATQVLSDRRVTGDRDRAGDCWTREAIDGTRVRDTSWVITGAAARHLAGMTPHVAVAVAGWLQACANDLAGATRVARVDEPGSVRAAYAVAAAYLGEETP